ncbi:MAG: alanine dehydrogenase [Candidatus Sumerlaeia bacterium]|nr:alanine dehydrogenase [Candidatus Sumerlaeia bacterium]
MIVGVPKEIKDHEYRVALTHAGAKELTLRGHRVVVQAGAGLGAGITDQEYISAGAEIVDTAEEVWNRATLIVKVKEPLKAEWKHIRPDHLLFMYFHFASSRPLTDAMIESGATCIAYETVTGPGGHPLLTPMSEIAGRLSIQQGAKYLEKPTGGRGTLMGGVPGVKSARVLVIGGGVVGTNAAKIAAGMGARVTMMDINLERLRYLDDVMPRNVSTLYCNELNVVDQLKRVDVVVGGVYISGAKAPHIIRREHLSLMPRGAVLVDVAIDQGGCFETSIPTTHSKPVYEEEGVIHYCVANMPGAVSRTATFALTNATQPWVIRIAEQGWPDCMTDDQNFINGINIAKGKVTLAGVSQAFDLPLTSVEEVLR